jgi:tetratricopeptide (TPR) repeat protein/transcriptional regulator with XRE-family HTH domain
VSGVVLSGGGEAMADGGGQYLPRRAEPSRFGWLLLGHRRSAGLTQEELASAAGVSVQAIGNLERGRARAAQPRSAEALCDALGLAAEQRAEFLAAAKAARRHTPGSPPAGDLAPASMWGLCAPPATVPDFVGRDRELRRLQSWSREARGNAGGLAIAVVGPAGVGKTALAAAAIHHLAAEFPGGCLAVDLRGMDENPVPARAALDRMLRSLGVLPGQMPHTVDEQSSLYRSMLAGRRMLVLLDNVIDEAQTRPLLAASHGCLTLITCRRALSGLEALRWMWLPPLPVHDTVELVARIVTAERVKAEPEAVRELVELCGNLPLAVRIAGNRLARHAHWSITSLTARLRDERTRLTSLAAGDLQVRPAFTVSYQRLSAPAQRMFRRLALVPGADFGVDLAAVAAETETSEARQQVEELIDTTLVQAAATTDRYQFHDLIRLFAREQLDAEEAAPAREHAAAAVHEHLLCTAAAAGRSFDSEARQQGDKGGFESQELAAVWLESEESNWMTALRRAAAAGVRPDLIRLLRDLRWYAATHQQHPWEDIFGWGVAAAQAVADQDAEATLLNLLGWAQGYCRRNLDAGIAAHRRALAIALETGNQREQALALSHLAAALVHLGRLDEALDHIQRSIALLTPFGDWPALEQTRNTRGEILRLLGRHEEALAAHREVLTDLDRRASTLPSGVVCALRAYTLVWLGEVLLEVGDWTQAAATFQDARSLITATELPGLAGEAAFHEGVARRKAGEPTAAVRCLRSALDLFPETSTRWWRARALAELAITLEQAGSTDEAREYRRQALALCDELRTDPARALAAEMRPQPH